MSSRVVSVWPCNHGDVEVEPVAVPLGLACAECGSYPEHFVPKTEYDRALETRENANAVSVRVEAENRRLREAVAEARDLVAEAYSDDEDNDSPGNMAFAILNHALEQSR